MSFDDELEVSEFLKLLGLVVAEKASFADWIKETKSLVCIYCGDNAKEQDHLLPLPYTSDAYRNAVPTVPSCKSCNSILSDALIPEIRDRCSHILFHLTKKHSKLLRAPVWLSHELNELEGVLRIHVESIQASRALIEARLTILELSGACNVSPATFKDSWRL